MKRSWRTSFRTPPNKLDTGLFGGTKTKSASRMKTYCRSVTVDSTVPLLPTPSIKPIIKSHRKWLPLLTFGPMVCESHCKWLHRAFLNDSLLDVVLVLRGLSKEIVPYSTVKGKIRYLSKLCYCLALFVQTTNDNKSAVCSQNTVPLVINTRQHPPSSIFARWYISPHTHKKIWLQPWRYFIK
jgi:hypothetical protein